MKDKQKKGAGARMKDMAKGTAQAVKHLPGLHRKKNTDEVKQVAKEPDLVEEKESLISGDAQAQYGAVGEADPPGEAPPAPTENAPKEIVLSPFWEFLLADTTIIFLMVVMVAVKPTLSSWDAVASTGQIPAAVALLWALVAFAAGQAFGISPGTSHFHPIEENFAAETKPSDAVAATHHVSFADDTVDRVAVTARASQKHSFISRATKSLPMPKIRFKSSNGTASLPKVVPKALSTLSAPVSKRLPWQKRADPLKLSHRPPIFKRLIKERRLSVVQASIKGESIAAMIDDKEDSSTLGSFELPTEIDSFESLDIHPLMELRGMDVFLTEDPEMDPSTHPWLIEQGLRDVPTLLVNIVTQWGNILIYFQLPSWIKDLDIISEDPGDAEDVAAFKKFLKGDSEYRNERLKAIPSVVDGPVAVKMLAPPKKETVLNSTLIPLSWKQSNTETKAGRTLQPIVEVQLDCISSRAVRSMAGIVKRNLKSLTIDVACTVSPPDTKPQDSEPKACLGLWRFDHIDVSACPPLPDRYSSSNSKYDPDIIRASRIMDLKMSDITMPEFDG